MGSRRAETLEALSAYLEHQRTLLARTQADIERLKRLKEESLVSPERFARCSSFQDTEEKLSGLQDYHPSHSLPTDIAWEAFSSSDPTPLRTLAVRSRINHTQQTVPSNVQQSPLSVLQKFVKDARKVILDPVLENLSTSPDTITYSSSIVTSNSHINSTSSIDPSHIPTLTLSSPDNQRQEPMTAIHKSKHIHEKIQGLKQCRIKADFMSECDMGEGESPEADVNMEMLPSCISPERIDDPMVVDNPGAEDAVHCDRKLPNSPGVHSAVLSLRHHANREPRTRKPSLKLQLQSLTPMEVENKSVPAPLSSQGLGKRSRDITEFNDTLCKSKSEPLSVSEVNAGTDKNRSDTYKQAWSISEQHLLERLLDEIPDGERNRWAKISQAMGGRRTPRQVASRVQKYFEKLKRFGVGVDNKGKAKS